MNEKRKIPKDSLSKFIFRIVRPGQAGFKKPARYLSIRHTIAHKKYSVLNSDCLAQVFVDNNLSRMFKGRA